MIEGLSLICLAIVFVSVAVILAKNKNRSVAAWVILTIIFVPSLLVLLALKPLQEK
mgnify:CR=1 FL=1